ncbi:hypothetical protein OSJ77_07510 [Phyllobacterium sp. 0TCS1.6C]|uniref:hypothetical protein n=1 Tax=unclassified Phyllobacterium TaxID=2638441 RepID=UPI0022641AFE|nr:MULTISPECIES: hypothetical protein [unclassified Phyllobacterium]MCX8280031.1 hypothetical protein [Phyllobacterium sp. 0TCS1.6C]MCX8296198.1 hypothetical protein [Phyllobacterium sp. 0TCS1.6A]
MHDLNIVLAIIVVVLLLAQSGSEGVRSGKSTRARLNDADWAVLVFTLTLTVLVALIAIRI